MRLTPRSTFGAALLALAGLVAFPLVSAQKNVLQTDSVTYCSDSKAVEVDRFSIAYHQFNQSVTFAFSLQAVEDNLNVSANIYVNAYGMDIVNETITLCSILAGVICPLPTANFTGFGTYPIPTKFTDKIPSIAYTVPDLEAFAQLKLLRVDSGETAVCLQTTLTNGHTTKQIGVAIGTGVFTLIALLVGIFHTALVNSPSPAQYRWFDILYLFQSAAASGFMHLNYPSVYSSFTQNFAWAMALFHSSTMQRSINSLRVKTGGHLTSESTGGNQTQYIDRQLSPYNVRSLIDVNSFESFAELRSYLDETPSLPNLSKRASSIASTIPQTNSSEIHTGIPVYTAALDIPQANALDTIFFFFLAFAGIAIVFHVLLGVIVAIFGRSSSGPNWARRLKQMWWGFCAGNALRLCLIFFLPLWIFGFWQFRIHDSGLSIFFAVFSILVTFIPLATVFGLSIIRSRRQSSTAPTISRLYTAFRWFHSIGVLYRPYRQRYHFFWFAPLVLAMIARAAFIAFGDKQAWAQVIGNVVVEAIVFVSIPALRPHKDRKGDWLVSFLSFCRLCAFGLLIAFIPSVGVKPIPRTIIGFVIIVLFGVPTILLLLGLFWNLGYGYWWRRHTHKIEDGLEVDRFVQSRDDDSQDRMAMRQSVDANNFVTSPGAIASRNSVGAPSRRRSIIEPVPNNDYNDTRYNNNMASQHTSPTDTVSPTTLASPMNPYRGNFNGYNGYNNTTSAAASASAMAYDQAASGTHGDYPAPAQVPRHSRQYQYGNKEEYIADTRGSSRRSSRISEYQTPMSGLEYHTPMGGMPGNETPRQAGN